MFKYPNARKPEPAPAPSNPFSSPEIPSDWAPVAAPEPAPEPASNGSFMGGEPAAPASPFASSAAAVPAAATSRNVLNSDVAVVGILRFTDDLLVDGTVEGEITSDGVLTVGTHATITAGENNKVAVNTKSAIIHGRVTGDVVVSDRVELASTAELVGDVTASKISIQEGAVFIGYCRVGVAANTPVPTPAPKKKGAAAGGDTNLLV